MNPILTSIIDQLNQLDPISLIVVEVVLEELLLVPIVFQNLEAEVLRGLDDERKVDPNPTFVIEILILVVLVLLVVLYIGESHPLAGV